MISDETIREMAGKIVSRFDPQRAVLFGSFSQQIASEGVVLYERQEQ